MSVRTSEMSELLEEMRRLRHDLERSINKQNELQMRLDENIRLSRAPREFTFSGRGVSYPDLRIIDGSGLVGTENLSFTSMTDEKRSRPLGASTIELGMKKKTIFFFFFNFLYLILETEQISTFDFCFMIKKRIFFLRSWKNVFCW